MKTRIHKHTLIFKKPSGTSRGVLLEKDSWFIILDDQGRRGIGECGLLKGLSIDDRDDYEAMLHWVADNIALGLDTLYEKLSDFPSIQFGLETAFLSLQSDNPFLLFPSPFAKGIQPIDINGLVWMGSPEQMRQQVSQKISEGFHCIKLKIGALDFDQEVAILSSIRSSFDPEQIEIRVDANGAFDYSDSLNKLNQLAGLHIHSIEQPISRNQYDNMAALCKSGILSIALDEELIGVRGYENRKRLLEKIKPQYLILKPSLLGGIKACNEWIQLAEQFGIGWWITSALESNIGLNAIAQWTATLGNTLPQGLGTGALYTNNFESPLEVVNGKLWYDPSKAWHVPWMNALQWNG